MKLTKYLELLIGQIYFKQGSPYRHFQWSSVSCRNKRDLRMVWATIFKNLLKLQEMVLKFILIPHTQLKIKQRLCWPIRNRHFGESDWFTNHSGFQCQHMGGPIILMMMDQLKKKVIFQPSLWYVTVKFRRNDEG